MHRFLKRLLTPLLLVVATAFFLVEEVLWRLAAVFALLGKLPVLHQLEEWITRLPPYGALAIFWPARNRVTTGEVTRTLLARRRTPGLGSQHDPRGQGAGDGPGGTHLSADALAVSHSSLVRLVRGKGAGVARGRLCTMAPNAHRAMDRAALASVAGAWTILGGAALGRHPSSNGRVALTQTVAGSRGAV